MSAALRVGGKAVFRHRLTGGDWLHAHVLQLVRDVAGELVQVGLVPVGASALVMMIDAADVRGVCGTCPDCRWLADRPRCAGEW